MTATAIPRAVQAATDAATSALASPSGATTKPPAAMPGNRPLFALVWLLHPLLDRNLRPSTVKCAIAGVLAIYARGTAVPVMVVLATYAAAFGYTVFKDLIDRGNWSGTSKDDVSIVHSVTETITAQRGPTGEALTSLPAKPGATTPAGDA